MRSASRLPVRVLADVQAGAYSPHSLHGHTLAWLEKNCYADVWIEMLHAMRLEPHAMLPFVLSVDFEGDQWTFFKPRPDDLWSLYGVDVQEMTVWRPLEDHLQEHLGAGKLVSIEVDAHWLPDVAGTDYRLNHAKTTIVVNEFDGGCGRLGYFHNAGYYDLGGEDFRRLLHLNDPVDATRLPLFAELVRIDRLQHRDPWDLRLRANQLLAEHLERRPAVNPMPRFAERFARDLPLLQTRGLAYYHAWAFATLRQCGAAFELAAAHLRWRAGFGLPDAADATAAASAFDRIATGCKALVMKVARSVSSGRTFDAAATFDDMALAWDEGIARAVRVAGA